MATRVIHLLKTSPGTSLFFAFGASHFVGEANIIEMVREAGFTVERVNTADILNGGTGHRANILLVLCSVTTIILNLELYML